MRLSFNYFVTGLVPKLLVSIFILTVTVSCMYKPVEAFKIVPATLQDRHLQSRQFETDNETALLVAAIGVLQDMGYGIDETEKELGLIAASKVVTANDDDDKEVALAINKAFWLWSWMWSDDGAVDDEQRIKVSLVTMPSSNKKNAYIARVSFQRIVWNTNGNVASAETIKDPDIYAGFFEKLSKSVFLEAHKL